MSYGPRDHSQSNKRGALSGAKTLAGMDSVAAKGMKLGKKPLVANEAVKPQNTVSLGSLWAPQLRWMPFSRR